MPKIVKVKLIISYYTEPDGEFPVAWQEGREDWNYHRAETGIFDLTDGELKSLLRAVKALRSGKEFEKLLAWLRFLFV